MDTENPMTVFRREADAMAAQFVRALPSHIPVERFVRILTTAVNQTPELLNADRRSLWNAAERAAEDGLLPDGRQGAIILRYGQRGPTAHWQPMVEGVRAKARNSGEIVSWDVQAVYEHDDFHFDLGVPIVTHSFDLKQPRGKLIGVYSIATLKGGRSYDVMTMTEVRDVRDRYSESWKHRKPGKPNPWADSEAEMAKKTVAHRHSKMLPMSTDLAKTIQYIAEADTEFASDRQEPRRRQLPPDMVGRLDALAKGVPDAPTPPDGHKDEDGAEDIAPDETGAVGATPQAAGVVTEPPAPPAADPKEPDPSEGELRLLKKLGETLSLAKIYKEVDKTTTSLLDQYPLDPNSRAYRIAADIRLAHLTRINGKSSPAETDALVAQLLKIEQA